MIHRPVGNDMIDPLKGLLIYQIGLSSSLLTAIVLIVTGYLVERKFVSRMSTFANGLAINIVLQGIDNRHWVLNLYGNFCLVMALIGALSYAWYQSAGYYERQRFPARLRDEYYDLSWLCGALASFLVSLNPGALNALLCSSIS